MCLLLSENTGMLNGRDHFLSQVKPNSDGLVVLYKHVRTAFDYDKCVYSKTKYMTPVILDPVYFYKITYSNRSSRRLTRNERHCENVQFGLHFYINWLSHYTYRAWAVAHMDDFVASAGNEAVFMKAIYTRHKPSQRILKKYAKMLKKDNKKNDN